MFNSLSRGAAHHVAHRGPTSSQNLGVSAHLGLELNLHEVFAIEEAAESQHGGVSIV